MTPESETPAAGADVPPVAGEDGAVSTPSRTKLKGIAVLGSHPETKALAPFNDPAWLIYACSPANSPFGVNGEGGVLPRADVWFEVHNPVFDATRPYQYLEWLSNVPKVYMRDPVAMQFRTASGELLFPTAVPYPERELKERFGPFLFTSSIAYMITKAIVDIEELKKEGRMEDQPVLALYGILQLAKREWIEHRQGTQNALWAATKSGIKVQVARQSGLLEPPAENF